MKSESALLIKWLELQLLIYKALSDRFSVCNPFDLAKNFSRFLYTLLNYANSL